MTLIADTWEKSTQTPVAPPAADTPADTFAYTDFGPPGKITARRHIDDLDITLVTYANGLRLNLKKTDYKTGEIQLRARLGTGRLQLPRDQPGLDYYTNLTFTAGGLGKHSNDDLRTLLAGRNTGLDLTVTDDAFVFSGLTTPPDLHLELQLLAAHLTDPGYRPEAARLAEKHLEQLYTRLDHTPAGPLHTTIPRHLANGDPRFGHPTRAEATRRTLDETKTWLAPHLARGPLELAIVGDIDIDATLDTVALTLGALPPRAPRPARDALADLLRVNMPAPPHEQTLTIPSTIPKGIISLWWPTRDALDATPARRLNLLAHIMTDRLRETVREKIGGAYSPYAVSDPSEVFPGYGFIRTDITIDPGQAEEITAAVLRIAQDLHDNGVTDDEITRARLPLLTTLRETARTNEYWLGAVLTAAQEQEKRLDQARTRYSDYEAITKADLDALAKTYLAPDRAYRFTILPVEEKK